VIVASPVAPLKALEELRDTADGVVCVVGARAFDAVGQWYDDFRPVTDDEVAALLRGSVGSPSESPAAQSL